MSSIACHARHARFYVSLGSRSLVYGICYLIMGTMFLVFYKIIIIVVDARCVCCFFFSRVLVLCFVVECFVVVARVFYPGFV